MRKSVEVFDKVAETYGLCRRDTGSIYFQDKIRSKAESLCQEAAGSLLEVGCGNGLFLMRLARSTQLELVGVDFSARMLEEFERKCQRKGLKNIRVYRGDALQLPFKDGSFDHVVCLNLLYNLHPSDVGRCISEMGRVCKDSGQIVVDLRNRNNFLVRYIFRRGSTPDCPVNAYTLREFEAMFARAGLMITTGLPVLFPFLRWAPAIILQARRSEKIRASLPEK